MKISSVCKNRIKMRWICPLLCLLLLFSGCSGKSEPQGLPDAEEISRYEALYGQSREEAIKSFGGALKESEGTENTMVLEMNQQRALCDELFDTTLLFYPQSGKTVFGGVSFVFRTTDREKAETLIQTLYHLSEDAYGEPATYIGILDRIQTCYIEKTRRSANAMECWNVGETFEYELAISSPDSEGATDITLLYQVRRGRQ